MTGPPIYGTIKIWRGRGRIQNQERLEMNTAKIKVAVSGAKLAIKSACKDGLVGISQFKVDTVISWGWDSMDLTDEEKAEVVRQVKASAFYKSRHLPQ